MSLLLVLLSLCVSAPVRATSGGVEFLGTVSAVGSAVGNPGQVTLDRNGNLWAVSNLHNTVVRWNGTSWTTVISGLSTPYGLAFDSSNNLFVSQTGVPGVYEYPAPNYASGTKLTPSFNSPVYLAFDHDDNLFVADSGNNAIYEVPVGGSYSTKTAVVSSGLNGPGGVALDVNGNLFVGDTSNGDVKMYTAASSYTIETTIATGLDWPMGIAVDPGGNVYVSEVLNGNMDLITASSGYTSLQTIYTNASTFGSRGVVIDPAGVVYEGDYGGGSVYRIRTGAVDLGSSAVGASTVATAVTFVFGANETGVHSAVLTTGQTAHDFTINNGDPGTCGGTAASNAFTSGQSCTVKVQYAATAPGLRSGVVELLDGSGNILATGFVYGTGSAPLAAFSPAAVSPVSMGALSPALSAPSNPAWRADGNLFFTDGSATGRLLQIVPGSGAPTPVSTGAYSIQNPKGVAIDGAGSVFVADAGNNRVLKVAADGTSVVIPSSAAMGNMGQIAVDASGRVYATDGSNGRIVVAPPSGNYYTLPVLGIDMTNPAGIVVDADYNVYVADAGANQIYKITYGIASTVDTSALTTGLSAPSSLGIDDNGTLYVSDTGNHRIVVVPASGTPSVLAYSYSTALSSPNGIAFDPTGQMYIADSGNNAIMLYDWTTAGKVFADTGIGSTSSDSPASVTLFNLGNTPLTLAIPGSGNNPSMSNSAFTLGSGTTCPELTSGSADPGTLAPLESCLLTINFQPGTAGLVSGTLTYTDDSLNSAGNSSVLNLSGSGLVTGDTTAVSFGALPSSLYVGESATVSVTVADSSTPSTIPTGSVSFNDSIQGALGSATLDASGVASLGTVVFTGAGTHTITASYAGGSGSFQASSNVASIAVNSPALPGAPTIGTATAGNTQATVRFTPPTSNGGSAITLYTASSTPGNLSASCSSSPCTVTGLSNGVSYTFTVTATNGIGTGAASAASNAVTPNVPSVTGSNPGGAGSITVGVGSSVSGCGLTQADFAAIPGDAALTAPTALTFPYGQATITIGGGCGTGYTATVTLTYPGAVPANAQLWKYGRSSSADTADHWYQLSAVNHVSISGNTVSYTVTDGAYGDDDTTENGVIIDPVALGVPASSAAIPAMGRPAELALATLLALLAVAGRFRGLARRR